MSFVHDEDVPTTHCPWCQACNTGAESFLGGLGYTSHHRCRSCGGQYAITTPPTEQDSNNAN